MPRKEKPVTVTISGETWELTPLAGTDAFVIVPKLIGLVSEAVYAAGRANINLKTLITDEGFNFGAITVDNLRAFSYVADMLVEKWDVISGEILPVLLCCKAEWLKKNGSPWELMSAIGVSLNFNAPVVFGDKNWVALKKSLTVENEPEEEEQSETD